MSQTVRFPGLYSRIIRLVQVDLNPSHFYDLLVLAFVGAALLTSLLTMGGVSGNGSDLAPRLLAAAAGLHALRQVGRAREGLRIRWAGALFLPFALWLWFDSRFHSPVVWRGREEAAVALTAAVAFWITLHHMRHRAHRWVMFAGMATLAAGFGALVINGEQNLLPKLANRSADAVYAGQTTGPFGTPGEFAAFLLLAGFPMAAVMISPALRNRRRIAAGVAVIFIVIGLWCAHHGPAWCGFFAGAALLALLLVESRRRAWISAAMLLGPALFAPRVARFDSGLFRTADSDTISEAARTPLPDAALGLFQSHPLIGVGSGGFPRAFETVRPWGWNFDPQTAGGFFHQLAAENGVAGILLFALPAIALWVFALIACKKLPVRLLRRDRQFRKTISYVPEPRIALAGALAGTLAAAVSISLDYARPSVALATAFAIIGAIAAREAFGDRFAMTVAPRPNPRRTLRALVAAAPILVFATAVFPVFTSAQLARRAEDILGEVPEGAAPATNAPTQRAVLIARANRREALRLAQISAETALRLEPDNARAAATLSGVHAARFRFDGVNDGLGSCLSLAESAYTHSSGEPAPSLALLTALRMSGDEKKAGEFIVKLRVGAPHNIPLALEQARLLVENGDSAGAIPTLTEVLAAEPWNREAKRLRGLSEMNPNTAAR